MIIREARRSDAEFIRSAQIRMALETENLRLDPAAVEKGVSAVFDDPGKGRYFVAETPDGKLAYMVKAAVARMRNDQVLIDLRRVDTPPGADGKFLICDRLRRALAPTIRVGLVATPDLVDVAGLNDLPQCADIALFEAEPDAVRWLGRRNGLVATAKEKVPRL